MLIIHISDIHLEKVDQGITFVPLVNAIQHLVRAHELIVVAITGDLAYSGKKEQYAYFETHLLELEDRMLQLNPQLSVRWIMVPGNHDCDFDRNVRVRDVCVKNIKENGLTLDAGDTSELDMCTSVQDHFFDYAAAKMDTPQLLGLSRLAYVVPVKHGAQEYYFNCYNTAWMSQKKEAVGTMYYPVSLIPEPSASDGQLAIRIGLYHHPENWLSPNHAEPNNLEFRTQVLRANDLVLTGHEHRPGTIEKRDVSRGDMCIFHESGAYFSQGTFGSFNIIDLDDDRNVKFCEYRFSPVERVFEPQNLEADGRVDQLSESRTFMLDDGFQKMLDENEVFLATSSKRELHLSDLFVYPRVEDINSGEIVDSQSALSEASGKCTVIFGADQSGKTSLLKQLYLKLYRQGKVPLLIDGKRDVHNENVGQIVRNAYSSQYRSQKKSFSAYQSLDISKKIILVDNLNSIPSKVQPAEFVRQVRTYSSTQILTSTDVASLDESINRLDGSAEFRRLTLLPFGNVNREQLIEKWYRHQDYTGDELFQIKVKTHDRVNDILGSNLVPSYPLYILTILQALESNIANRTEISSYGHCYQTLIYLTFKRVGLQDDEFTVVDNFLAFLSFRLHDGVSNSFTSESFAEMHREYLEKFVVSESPQELLEVLTRSRVMTEDGLGNISFRHIYIYYYYVAKYLAKNYANDIKRIERLCAGITKREDSFVLLFLTYHTSSNDIIDAIVLNTMGVLEQNQPATLASSEIDFMTEFVQNIARTVIENIKPEEYRSKQLETRDKVEKADNEKEDFSRLNQRLDSVNRAFKCIEINGQILKNRYGSIQKDRLDHIVQESFLTSFRLITFFIEDLEKNINTIVDHIESDILQRNNDRSVDGHVPITYNRQLIYKEVRDIVAQITYYVCHYTLEKSATALGNQKIMEFYESAAKKIGSPASVFMSFLISTKFADKIDKNRLLKMLSDFKDNPFLLSILRKAVVNFIYMHNVNDQDKSWLSAKLGISVQGQRRIENKKTR